MATTKIWPIKENLKYLVKYIANKKKTEIPVVMDEVLQECLSYACDGSKTEERRFVTALNCSLDTAYEEMIATKRLYKKEDSIQGYHAVQSFVEGEVTAEQAHFIGVEMANELWGDRFEVVIATHLNTNHYHNHFVLNSVSFADGKRYYDCKSSYRKLSETSDRLCEKYGLHIIERKGKGMNYAEHLAIKNNQPRSRDAIIEDVEKAINSSKNFTEFLNSLKKMGYGIRHKKYVSLISPIDGRHYRMNNLTRDGKYSEENVRERIRVNVMKVNKAFNRQSKPKLHLHGQINHKYKFSGLRAVYIKYLYALGKIPKKGQRIKQVSSYVRKDVRYLKQITKEVTFMYEHDIHHIHDLDMAEETAKSKLEQYINERKCFYSKRKSKRITPEDREKIESDIETLSFRIKILRSELKTMNAIRLREEVYKKKEKEENALKKQLKQKNIENEKEERSYFR